MTNTLSERALLGTLHIHMWTARKYDRQISADVAKSHNTREEAGRYNKRLLPFEAPSYEAVKLIAGQARAYHYEQTLPWGEDGIRILPSSNYLTYAQAMSEFRDRFTSSANEFCKGYPDMRKAAKKALNGMYRDEDYPEDRAIANKFGFELSFLPFPDAADFRVKLGDEHVNMVRDQITRQVESATQIAMRDLWQRLYDAVTTMSDKLNDPDAIFRDTLVGNLRDLCQLLPRLNFTHDKELEAMRHKVEGELARYGADALRQDKTLRASVAQQAADIRRAMATYMGA